MQVTTIGIDLAKNVFQVHGVDARRRGGFQEAAAAITSTAAFAKLARCLVGMEACASAHHWAREFKELGHDVRMMPAKAT